MRVGRKIWALVALVLIACGVGFGLVGFAMAGFDVTKLNSGGREVTNEHVITEDFSKIEISTSVADVRFETATDGKAKVVCVESEKLVHDVKVQDGTLIIKETSKKKWFEYIGFFNFGSTKKEVVVYLPEKKAEGMTRKLSSETKCMLDGLKVETSTGDVKLNDLSVKGELKIDVSTADLNLSNVVADSMIIDTSTGSVTMNATEVLGNLKINTSTGDVKLTRCDADSVRIDTSTGDVTCEFLSGKTIRTDTSTGTVKLPSETAQGGDCVIDTSTGDITVTYGK